MAGSKKLWVAKVASFPPTTSNSARWKIKAGKMELGSPHCRGLAFFNGKTFMSNFLLKKNFLKKNRDFIDHSYSGVLVQLFLSSSTSSSSLIVSNETPPV